MCKAAWSPPRVRNGSRNATASPPAAPVVGGRCADVPTEDGSTAGGAWCNTVEKTCANNPKASQLPAFGRDFDYCG
jgi:hypothetical protein